MRRLIYSQLPLPLGTLPRSTAAQSGRTLPADRKRPLRREDRDSPDIGVAAGRVYERSGGAKSTERTAKIASLDTQIAIPRNP